MVQVVEIVVVDLAVGRVQVVDLVQAAELVQVVDPVQAVDPVPVIKIVNKICYFVN